jgi:hypothetical protein
MPVSLPSRIVGILLLAVTIGLASCQALFVAAPETPRISDQTGTDQAGED